METNVTFEESVRIRMKGDTSTELIFAENIVSIICKALTILLILRLLYYVLLKPVSLKQRQPSGGMVVLLFVHLLGALSSMPYNIYLVVHGKLFINDFDPPTMFWTGLFHSLYTTVAPVAVFFLTLERCLVLVSSTSYESRYKRRIDASNLSTLSGAITICVVFSLLELPLVDDAFFDVSHCGTFMCTQHKFKCLPQTVIKTIFETANLVATAHLIRLLKRTSHASANANNRAIKVTVVLEVFLCVIPGYTDILRSALLPPEYSASAYLGEYVAVLLAVNSVICSSYYSWLYLHRETTKVWQTPVSSIKRVAAISQMVRID